MATLFLKNHMAATSPRFPDQWKRLSTHARHLIILAAVALVSVFFPWMSFSIAGMDGPFEFPTVRVNGMRSFGTLTFLGSLVYLLWTLLPLMGIKLPVLQIKEKTLTQILGLVMLAGPVLWLLQSGFSFSLVGIGLWIALIASGIFVYKVFTGK